MNKSGSKVDKCGMCGKNNNIGPNAELVMTWHLAYTHMLLKMMIPKAFQEKIFSPKLPESSNRKQDNGGKLKKVKETKVLEAKMSCPLCTRKLKTLSTLKCHLAMHHFKNELLNRSGSSLHKCGICEKQYGPHEQKNTRADYLMIWHLAYTHKILQGMIPTELNNLIFCNPNENESASVLNRNKANNEVTKSCLKTSQREPPSRACWKDLETLGNLSQMSGALDNSKQSGKLQSQLVLDNVKAKNDEWRTQNEGHEEVKSDTDNRQSETLKTSMQKSNLGGTKSSGRRVCFICEGNYKTWRSLQSHLAQYHFKEELLKKSGSSPARCGICDRGFIVHRKDKSRSDQIICNHLALVHDMLKPLISHEYACDDLDMAYKVERRFKNQSISTDSRQIVSYSKRKRVHVPRLENNFLHCEHKVKNELSPAKRHQCFLCSSWSTTLRSLRCHVAQYHFRDELLTMSKSTQDACGICQKQFIQPGRVKSRADAIMTWHLAFKHNLLRELIPQNINDSLYRCKKSKKTKEETIISCKSFEVSDRKENNSETLGNQIQISPQHETLRSLRNEELLHSGPVYQCFLCSSTTKTSFSLKRHLAQYHFKDDLLKRSGSQSDTCGICGKRFSKPGYPQSRVETSITLHLAVQHDLLKKIMPKSSNKALCQGRAAKLRKKKQAEEAFPKQPCFLCTNTYKTWETLKSHLAIYHFKDDLLKESGSSSEQCGICKKQFNQSGWHKSAKENCLSRHLAYNHGLLGRLIPKYSKFNDTKQLQQQPVPDQHDHLKLPELHQPDLQQPQPNLTDQLDQQHPESNQIEQQKHQSLTDQTDPQQTLERERPVPRQPHQQEIESNKKPSPPPQELDQLDQLQQGPNQLEQNQPIRDQPAKETEPEEQTVSVEMVEVSVATKDKVERQEVFGGGKTLVSFSDLAIAAQIDN